MTDEAKELLREISDTYRFVLDKQGKHYENVPYDKRFTEKLFRLVSMLTDTNRKTGHPNGGRKPKEIDIDLVLELLEKGFKQYEIGDLLGTSQATIFNRLKESGYTKNYNSKKNI